MTWERFERTGAVEDYLLYKRVTSGNGSGAAVFQEKQKLCNGVTEHGTDDNGDRHGAGRTSIR